MVLRIRKLSAIFHYAAFPRFSGIQISYVWLQVSKMNAVERACFGSCFAYPYSIAQDVVLNGQRLLSCF